MSRRIARPSHHVTFHAISAVAQRLFPNPFPTSRESGGAPSLLGAATAVWTALGTTVEAFGPHIHRDSVESADKVAKALGRKRFAELSARHVRLGKDEAIDLAMGARTSTKARPAKSPLTKREREIAALIAQGMRNRAVAESLVISPRTVDGHVERILAKLDFTSRAQIAAWVASSHADPKSG